MGWINTPSKAAYNKIYNITTVSVKDILNTTNNNSNYSNELNTENNLNKKNNLIPVLFALLFIVVFL